MIAMTGPWNTHIRTVSWATTIIYESKEDWMTIRCEIKRDLLGRYFLSMIKGVILNLKEKKKTDND
jgi:hypothetical protein